MKKFLFILSAALTAMSLSAAPVDQATAAKRASSFLGNTRFSSKMMAPLGSKLELKKAEASRVKGAGAVYYIFTTPSSYVVVAGDDRAEQILAYGDYCLDLNNIAPGLQDMLGQYKDAIEFLQQNPVLKVDPVPSPKTSTMLKATSVGPLLPCNWDQDAPYWNQCTFGSYQCYTGCPATSASMVMYYWKYPTDPTPPVPGYESTIDYSYWGSVNYSHTALPSVTFDWDNMLDTYTGSYTTAQGDAVATLMHYVGQAERMMYGTAAAGGSGISVDSVQNIVDMYKFFGYDENSVRMVKKTSAYSGGTTLYTDAEWAAIIQEEMFAERPIVFCAVSSSGGGHAFNVDGYDSSTNKYHINFGWSGEDNDWCSLNAFGYSGSNFNQYQQAVIGIQPPATGPSIKVNPATLALEAFVDQSATATIVVKGQELNSDITLTLNDPDGCFAIDDNNVAINEQEEGKTITVTYSPTAAGTHTATITVANAEVEAKTVTITGTATIDTHTPVMQPADEAFIGLTQFRADWTDLTAGKFVDSYTLEVNTKPYVSLLEEVDWSDVVENYTNISNNPSQVLPEGWEFNGTGLWAEDASISIGSGSAFSSPTYDLAGYDKLTVVFTAKAYSTWSSSIFTVATSKGSQSYTLTDNSAFQQFVLVLDCAEADRVTFTGGGSYPQFQNVKIYGGDATDMVSLKAISESGDATYRLITGITDKAYTVTGLEAAGTFNFRVKALYTDGTESSWSNTQTVTLFENGHSYAAGDVNHDGSVSIADVTALIDYLLSGDGDICLTCADVNGDGDITIADVTDLIDMLLGTN